MTETHFLNIDLDIESEHDITSLINELETKELIILHRERKSATLESNLDGKEILDSFDKAISSLSNESKKLWDSSYLKVFDIGFDSGDEPRIYQYDFSNKEVKIIATLGATMKVTIYAESE